MIRNDHSLIEHRLWRILTIDNSVIDHSFFMKINQSFFTFSFSGFKITRLTKNEDAYKSFNGFFFPRFFHIGFELSHESVLFFYRVLSNMNVLWDFFCPPYRENDALNFFWRFC